MTKFKDVALNSSPAPADFIIGVSAGGADQRSPLSAILSSLYPVGSLYMNAVNGTNPASLLGFGTWVAFGAGKVPIGINSADADFATVGQTGGQKDVQAHKHALNGYMPNSTGVLIINDSNGDAVLITDNAVSGENIGNWSPAGDGRGVQVTGSGSTNMNPYVVVYMWQRTA
jgi:hypothetical protein